MTNHRPIAFSLLITLGISFLHTITNASSNESEENISGIGGTGHWDQPGSEDLIIPDTTELPEIPHAPEIPSMGDFLHEMPAVPTAPQLPEIPQMPEIPNINDLDTIPADLGADIPEIPDK
jgi:hypothetical protein